MNPLEAIEAAFARVLKAEGFDLVLVERSGRILRLFIDRFPTEGIDSLGEGQGVSIDDCVTVSRLVGDMLDAEGLTDQVADICGGSFNLEVSSPGLDRPLVRPGDFARFVGRDIKLRTREAIPLPDGVCRKTVCRLLRADDDIAGSIGVMIDGHERSVRYGAIERARLVPEF